MGSFVRIGPGIEGSEPSLCGGAPRAVILGGILKGPDPACTHPKTYVTGCFALEIVLFHSCISRHRPNPCKSDIGLWRAARLILKLMPPPGPAHGPGRHKCVPRASLTPWDGTGVRLGGLLGLEIGKSGQNRVKIG
jgi:hypothetical protein